MPMLVEKNKITLTFIKTRLSVNMSPVPPYIKTCAIRPLKADLTKLLMINGSLMNVESIAECSP